MPSKEAHLAAARENQIAINYLVERLDQFPGWTTTVAFYKALHVIEALFAIDGAGSSGHTDEHKIRNKVLKTTSRYQQLWHHYRELFQASLIARYLRSDEHGPEHEIFSQYMSPDAVRGKVLNHWLLQIEKSARNLAGERDFPL